MTQHGYQVRVGSADPVGQAAQSGPGHLSAAIPASLPDLPQTQWQLALPLQAGGATIGVLDVHFDDEQPPSEERVQVLRTLADQLATRLENIQLLAQTQASLEELRSLYRATTAEAWERFIKVQPDLNRYQAGEAEVPEETWKSLFAQARSLAQPVTAEVKGDGRFALAVPVKLRGVPIGVMGFHRPLETGEWQPEEIALAVGAAERVALALENVRLLEETQRRAREEHLLGEVTARIRAPMDVDTILQTAVRELGRAMGVDRVSVYLAPEEEAA